MKIYDKVKKVEVEINDYKELIQIMRDGRQVDLYLKEKTSDDMGYMTWDVEHWSSVDNKRFIRCYSLEGRVLSESTGHNIYDLENDFKPEDAAKIELSQGFNRSWRRSKRPPFFCGCARYCGPG